MKESNKDAIEFTAAQTAAAVLELLPLGSLLSRALIAPIEFAERQRTTKILDAFAADIAELQSQSRLPDIDSLASSDRFMAVLSSAFLASKSTADPDKLRRLRNAVFNTQIDDVEAIRAELFVRLLDRYSELHVRILEVAEPLPPFVSKEESFPVVDGKQDGVMRDLFGIVQRAVGDPLGLLMPAFNDLRNDGLLVRTQPVTYGLNDTGDPTRPDSMSKLGRAFLFFVRDPS
ncbi:hypothetical protein [Microbacterium sp. K24]|uniref:hypothetical protein n=1 Tax=Microbacterium sp. K24 TaxID=2305446 RepID=UPI00109D5337|nr:hypothetical protein [Microbacterium sp. K24]